MRKIYIALSAILFTLFSVNIILAQEPSESSTIREKVQKKVEEALKNPKAYIGSVTDITENAIQIKPANGEIKQISVDTNIATVINSTGKTPKEVKLTDVAIGDFIVAMGFKGVNSVLDAKRILVITPLEDPGRKSYIGVVSAQTKTTSTLKTLKDESDVLFTTSTKTKVAVIEEDEISNAKVTDLEVGDKVLISGVEDSKGVATRRILILQKGQ